MHGHLSNNERCKIASLKIDGAVRDRRIPVAWTNERKILDGRSSLCNSAVASPFRGFKRDDKYFSRVVVRALQRLRRSKRANDGDRATCTKPRARGNVRRTVSLPRLPVARLVSTRFMLYSNVGSNEGRARSRWDTRRVSPLLRAVETRNGQSRGRHVSHRTFESGQS